jgi:hypothetical protein
MGLSAQECRCRRIVAIRQPKPSPLTKTFRGEMFKKVANCQDAALVYTEGHDPRLSLELAYRVCQRGVGVKQRLEGELHDVTIILIAK